MAQLLSSLPLGTIVKFGKHSINGETALPIEWMVADKNHSGYPTGSVTLVARYIIDLRAYDASEGDSSETPRGNDLYKLSNLHQWLNSSASAGQWYAPSNSADEPPTAENVDRGAAYYDRPGFLYNFASSEQAALLSTTLYEQGKTAVGSSFSAKVFLLSIAELGAGESFVKDNSSPITQLSGYRYCTATSQVLTYSTSTQKPSSTSASVTYWTRNDGVSGTAVYCVDGRQGEEVMTSTTPNSGYIGVRPALNLSGNMAVSDITDSSGAYTFAITNAPSLPANVQITTSKVYTTKPCSVKWNASSDPNGDVITYKLHTYYDGVEYGTPVNLGSATSYTLPSVKSGVSSIGFGVEAIDTSGHSSGISQVTVPVYTNNAPIISGSNTDLGTKTSGFSQTYTITDADNGAVTVTEYIDNVKVRSYVATLGSTNTFAITDKTWLKLANGIHTLKITATDGVDESNRVYTFTKTVNKLVIQRVTPLPAATKPSRLVVTVVKNIPQDAIFKVEACNNGFDTTPTWEDITSSILSGQTHVFANAVKTAGEWGVNIRVTVNRNGSEGACYITEIGGNFE